MQRRRVRLSDTLEERKAKSSPVRLLARRHRTPICFPLTKYLIKAAQASQDGQKSGALLADWCGDAGGVKKKRLFNVERGR